MITHRLTLGLCIGDKACPENVAEIGGGGVYSFDRITEEAKKALEESVLVIVWNKMVWRELAVIGQLGGIMVFAVIVGSALKLMCRMLYMQVCVHGLWGLRHGGGLDGEQSGVLEEDCHVHFSAGNKDEPMAVIECCN